MDCISVENMRQSDAYTIANFTPSRELMHRAAMGVFLAGSWAGKTAILTGSGNNGGDGFALACILQARGLPCTVFAVSEKCSADGAFYKEKALAAGVPVLPFGPGCLAGCPLLPLENQRLGGCALQCSRGRQCCCWGPARWAGGLVKGKRKQRRDEGCFSPALT